jgi:hypothetical protein
MMNVYFSRPRPGVCRAAAIIMLVMLSGCTDSADIRRVASDAEADDAKQATFAEHDHERPPHMPANFPQAVAELRRRHLLWTASTFAREARPTDPKHQELYDIVGWLPMLAADSDLTEAEWLPVKHATDRLTAFYGNSVPGQDAVKASRSPESIRQAERDLATLEAIAADRSTAFDSVGRPRHCVAHIGDAHDEEPPFHDATEHVQP